MSILGRISALILVSACPLAFAQSSPQMQVIAPPTAHVHIFQFGSAVAPAQPSLGAKPVFGPLSPDLFKLPTGSWSRFATFQNSFQGQLMPRMGARARSFDNNSICYAMRSYDFAVSAPGSDVTRLSGTSNCRPAKEAQLKPADNPRVSMPY